MKAMTCLAACAWFLLAGALPAGEVETLLEQKAAYRVVEVAGGGALVGAVRWTGELPEVVQFPIHKNVEVCAAHRDTELRPSPRLVVDPETRGVANAVVFLADVAAGRALDTLPETELNQVECEFTPHLTLLAAGAKLPMKSSDEILHNVHATGPSGFNKPFPLAGVVIAQRMRKPGVCELRCDAGHSWMSGFVFVVQHPYFAVTDAAGRFRLDDVPPGRYRVYAWHEGWQVTATDRDPEGAITHYEFDAPREWCGEVDVAGGAEATLDLGLGAGGFARPEGT